MKQDKELITPLTLFDHLNNITYKKLDFDEHNTEFTTNYKPYIINRFISMCNIYLPIVSEINKYYLDNKVHYEYFKNIIPKRKHFFKYISKKKDVDDDLKQQIANHLKIGRKEVEDYVRILSEKEIKEIVKFFDHGNKTKKDN
jgi:hypothetical protein